MTTLAQVISATRKKVMTSQKDVVNQLDVGIDNDDTTITLKHATLGITPGTVLGLGLEELKVITTSGNTPGSTATVIRGFNGSTAVSHLIDALVYVNPKVSDYDILLAINEELDDLSPRLYCIRSIEIPYLAAQQGYDLTGVTGLIDVWRVKADQIGPEQEWPVLSRSLWRVDQDANTTDFPTGKALIVYADLDPGRNIRVSYRATFSPLSAVGDDVAAVSGLHVEAHRLLSVGAAINTLTGREVKRSFMSPQPEPRRADEVPPGAAAQAIRPLLLQRDEWMRTEQIRLHKRYPEQLQ